MRGDGLLTRIKKIPSNVTQRLTVSQLAKKLKCETNDAYTCLQILNKPYRRGRPRRQYGYVVNSRDM